MGRIHAVFLDLDPIARHDIAAPRPQFDPRRVEGVVHRKWRQIFGRAQVGKHQAVELVRRISSLEQLLFDPAGRWFARRVENCTVEVIVPAVVAAADAALLDEPKFK